MTEIYVDADACPVRHEVVRVAERHKLRVHLVSNTWMRYPDGPLVNKVVVGEGSDVADDWITERISSQDICVTADIPLAGLCIEKGAAALGHTGEAFTEDSIGMALAIRDLKTHLRSSGEIKDHAPTFGKADRSRFLSELEEIVRKKRVTA